MLVPSRIVNSNVLCAAVGNINFMHLIVTCQFHVSNSDLISYSIVWKIV